MAATLVLFPPLCVARDFIDYPYVANLGAVQLASVLNQQDGGAVVVDALALPGSTLTWRDDGRARLGASPEQTLAAVDEIAVAFDFVVVAYTPFHRPPHRDDVLGPTLEGLRRRVGGCPIVLADLYQSGQHYVEVDGNAVLSSYPEIDAYVKYEGEVTVPELIRAFREGGPTARPTGTHRGAQPDLASLPVPAWECIELDAYWRFHERVVASLGRSTWAFPLGSRTLPMVTSRGCPFRCLHCSSNPDREGEEVKRQRRLPPEQIRRHMSDLVDHGADQVHVLDELINVNEAHFDAFLDSCEAHDLRFEIPNGMRADYVLERHLQTMRGRMTTLSISAESGSQRVLDEVVGKQLDLDEIRRVAARARVAGVDVLVHFMIGLPSETAEEINETLAFAFELWDEHEAYPAVQFATPLPGTRLAERRGVRASLALVTDWGPHFQHPHGRPELEPFMATFRKRLEASRGPKKLVMNVTYVCNNHCTFCAVGTRTQIDGHPTRQREHLERYAATGVQMVDFDGGEPTLNPELVPLIKDARKLGFTRINVTTNGRRCAYEHYASQLVNSGLTTLLFSIHGADAKTHAQQVGVAEAFDQSIAGIQHCERLRPRGVELGMNITLTKGNYQQLDSVAELAYDLGLRWLNIQFLTPFGRATRMVAPDTEEAAALTMRVIDAWRDRLKIEVINLPFCFVPGYEDFVQGDMQKLARHMVFVNNETVNLAGYLAERRTRKPQCGPCPHASFCGGFYELDDVPEPTWLIEPSDLVRPIDDPRRHESVPAGFHDRIQKRES